MTALPFASPADAIALDPGPPRIFADPFEVLTADLEPDDKRAILASWASDLWAVESAPALRHCPGLIGRTAPLDRILEALRGLDEEGRPEASWPDAPSPETPPRMH